MHSAHTIALTQNRSTLLQNQGRRCVCVLLSSLELFEIPAQIHINAFRYHFVYFIVPIVFFMIFLFFSFVDGILITRKWTDRVVTHRNPIKWNSRTPRQQQANALIIILKLVHHQRWAAKKQSLSLSLSSRVKEWPRKSEKCISVVLYAKQIIAVILMF